MWHSRVVYETSAGSHSKVTESERFRRQAASVRYIRSESCDNSTMVRCSSFCDLTPPALGFVISSCLDLLIGSPQAVFTQRLCHWETLNRMTTIFLSLLEK